MGEKNHRTPNVSSLAVTPVQNTHSFGVVLSLPIIQHQTNECWERGNKKK